jgi:hypothetical protein
MGGDVEHQGALGEEHQFDPDTLVLRRADPDDCDAIINLVDLGEDDHYNRVYSYPKILKLIETAYLAITVIERETGTVLAFAAFEDCPVVSISFRLANWCVGLTRHGGRSPLQPLGGVG